MRICLIIISAAKTNIYICVHDDVFILFLFISGCGCVFAGVALRECFNIYIVLHIPFKSQNECNHFQQAKNHCSTFTNRVSFELDQSLTK